MLNEPRTYRNPTLPLIFAILMLVAILIIGIFTFITFLNLNQDQNTFFFILPFGIIIISIGIILVLAMTSKTVISDTEISSQNILGTKSLRWDEIHRVSGSGYGIKLHNFDGDVTVSPNSQLPGYEEVVEWIGIKRPDLFNPQEYGEMRRNWAGTILSIAVVILIVGFGVLGGISSSQWFPSVFFLVIGLVILATIFSTPQSVSIQGNSLLIKYLFSEKALRVDAIELIQLAYQRSRNGKNYYVRLNLPDKKTIRISNMNPGLPIVYWTLKNWHKRNVVKDSSF